MTQYSITRTELEEIGAALDLHGSEVDIYFQTDYSGRGMWGKSCLAFATKGNREEDHPNLTESMVTFEIVSILVQQNEDFVGADSFAVLDEIRDILGSLKIGNDSLGLGSVTEYRNITVEPWEEEL